MAAVTTDTRGGNVRVALLPARQQRMEVIIKLPRLVNVGMALGAVFVKDGPSYSGWLRVVAPYVFNQVFGPQCQSAGAALDARAAVTINTPHRFFKVGVTRGQVAVISRLSAGHIGAFRFGVATGAKSVVIFLFDAYPNRGGGYPHKKCQGQ